MLEVFMHSVSSVLVAVKVFALCWVRWDGGCRCTIPNLVAAHVLQHYVAVVVLVVAWMLVCPVLKAMCQVKEDNSIYTSITTSSFALLFWTLKKKWKSRPNYCNLIWLNINRNVKEPKHRKLHKYRFFPTSKIQISLYHSIWSLDPT